MSSTRRREKRGSLLVISGPSGVGKDTIVQRLREMNPQIVRKISYTTRTRRVGEENGVDYFFVSPETFAQMEQDGDFLESACFQGNYYGTSRTQVRRAMENGQTMSLIVDVQGAALLRPKLGDAVFVFIKPPSPEALEARLRERGTETEESLQSRLEVSEKEMKQADWYDVIVVNDEVDRAAQEILEALRVRQNSIASPKGSVPEI